MTQLSGLRCIFPGMAFRVHPQVSLFASSVWETLADTLRRKLLITNTLSEEDLRHCVVEALKFLTGP